VERPDERIKSVVLIEVAEALPLRSPANELGPTEEKVVAFWKRYSPSPTSESEPGASF
jgi:hypothetical protein